MGPRCEDFVVGEQQSSRKWGWGAVCDPPPCHGVVVGDPGLSSAPRVTPESCSVVEGGQSQPRLLELGWGRVSAVPPPNPPKL